MIINKKHKNVVGNLLVEYYVSFNMAKLEMFLNKIKIIKCDNIYMYISYFPDQVWKVMRLL